MKQLKREKMGKQNGKGGGKTSCDNFTYPPTEKNYNAWTGWNTPPVLISVEELMLRFFNNEPSWSNPYQNLAVGVRWDMYTNRGINFLRFPCGKMYLTDGTVYDLGQFIYRFEIYDMSDNLVHSGCFNPICDVTFYKLSLPDGQYKWKLVDFWDKIKPEVKENYVFTKPAY